MIVGVGVFGQVVCHEVDLLPLRVHCHQLLHNDPLRGDGAFTAAIGVIVPVQPGQTIPAGYDVTVQPMNLQKVFLALCGEEGAV